MAPICARPRFITPTLCDGSNPLPDPLLSLILLISIPIRAASWYMEGRPMWGHRANFIVGVWNWGISEAHQDAGFRRTDENMNSDKALLDDDFKVVFVCVALSILILVVDSLIPLGVAGGIPYITVVLVSLWSPRKNLPYYFAVLGSLLTILGFFTSPPGGEMWKVLFNRFLALFAIWVTAVLSVQRKALHEERESALNEVRILKGIIPICSYCRKLRDDEGAWSQLESYFARHSAAELSHGICPDCLDKVMAEIDLSQPSSDVEGDELDASGDERWK